MVTDEVVFKLSICARFHPVWKHGGNRRSRKCLDGQCGEAAVWWALMHILEEWAEKSQQERNRANDTPRLTHKKGMSSGPPAQPGPAG